MVVEEIERDDVYLNFVNEKKGGEVGRMSTIVSIKLFTPNSRQPVF